MDVMAVGAPDMSVADMVTDIIKEKVLKVGREERREGGREGGRGGRSRLHHSMFIRHQYQDRHIY